MTTIIDVSRRQFLNGVFSTGAFVVGARLFPLEALAAQQAGTAGGPAGWEPSVYLGIERSGAVKIVAHRSEMGTGARTCLPMIVADELEADWSRVTIVQALGDLKYGSQNTDGSCSVRDFYQAMRAAGAAARTTLEHAAAGKWGVAEQECQGRQHFVVHAKTGRKIAYGDLVPLASSATAPSEGAVRFKTPQEFRYIGRNIPLTDLDDLVTGKGIFGIDARVPGMVYASIVRPPVMGATIKSVDDAAAKQVRGVQQVVKLDLAAEPLGFKALGGPAVIAGSSWAAMQGRNALKVEWNAGEHASYESKRYRDEMLETVRKPGRVVRQMGDVDADFAKGGGSTRRPTTRRCCRTRRWSLRPRWPSSGTARSRPGAARRTRRPCRTPSRRRSGSRRTTCGAT